MWGRGAAVVLLLAAAAWSFFYRLGGLPLLDDPNEAEYAEVAREMVDSGDWITPRLNYVLFLNKPPLAYWLIAGSFTAFGVNELAARLPVALAALLIVGLLVWLGTALFDAETGVLAGVVLVATSGFFFEAHAVRPDLILTASIVGSLGALARLCRPVSRFGRPGEEAVPGGPTSFAREMRGPLLVLQLSLAAGLLGKGMLAVLVPAGVFAVLVVTERRFDLLLRLLHPRAWWLFLLLMVPWHLVMSLEHTGFLWDYVVNQHVLFFFDRKFPRDSVPVSLGVFWAAFALRLFPWTIFAPLAFVTAGRRAWRGADGYADRLVLAWAAVVLLFFSAASSRMEHYSIPALPAAALLIAKLFRDYARADVSALSRVVTGHVIAFAAMALAGPFVVPEIVAAQAWLAPLEELPGLARTVFGGLAAGACVAAIAALRGRRRWVPLVIAATVVMAMPSFHRGLRLLARVNSSADMAATLRRLAQPGARLVYEAPIEYQNCAGFNFYLRRKLDLLHPAEEFIPPTYLQPYAGDLFISRADLERFWRRERVFLITDPLASRPSLAGAVPEPFHIVARDATRWAVSNQE